MQDPWMDRLSEYLDEELGRSERESLEAHLKHCPACASALADLETVRARARRLREEPAPAELWPRIEAAIASRRRVPFPADRIVSRRSGGADPARGARFSFSLPELIAACLAIAVLSGGLVFALARHPGSRVAAPGISVTPGLGSSAPNGSNTPRPEQVAERTASPGPSTAPAARTVEAVPAGRIAESPHEEAIAELRKALAKERDRLDPATIRTLESNLAIIDLAIDQAKRALTADPANTYVKEHLADTMRRKVELLQRATMLASASGPEGSR